MLFRAVRRTPVEHQLCLSPTCSVCEAYLAGISLILVVGHLSDGGIVLVNLLPCALPRPSRM